MADEQSFLKYATERKRLERATLVGPMAESKAVMAALHEAGWHIKRAGPYIDAKTFPKTDPTRFLIVAECVLEANP